MKIRHEDLTGTFEQKKKLVGQFTLLQDIFFSAVMQDRAAAEYVLRLCTGISDLRIIESDTQKSFRNLYGKAPVLDFYAEDSNHKLYNIEVQNSDDEQYFGPLRARYYQSILDASLFPKGLTYENLPEMYIIFITPFNPLKEYNHHKVIYEKKSILEDVVWDNRVHEVYLNTEETDDTKLSEMLQYFKTADPDDKRFGALSDAVYRHKDTEEGVLNMCKAVEDYANERADIKMREGKIEGNYEKAVEVVGNLLAKNFTLSAALEIAGIDEETYKKYQ